MRGHEAPGISVPCGAFVNTAGQPGHKGESRSATASPAAPSLGSRNIPAPFYSDAIGL